MAALIGSGVAIRFHDDRICHIALPISCGTVRCQKQGYDTQVQRIVTHSAVGSAAHHRCRSGGPQQHGLRANKQSGIRAAKTRLHRLFSRTDECVAAVLFVKRYVILCICFPRLGCHAEAGSLRHLGLCPDTPGEYECRTALSDACDRVHIAKQTFGNALACSCLLSHLS